MRCVTFVALSLVTLCVGCNGGSGSDGVIFQGTLTERGAGHSEAQSDYMKHSSGERIGEVKVCVLGACSITDDLGQWGVNVGDFTGGDVAVVLEGHGINGSVSANVPATAQEVEMDLDHSGNTISIAKLLIDGEDHTAHADHDHSENSEQDHSDHAGHNHSKSDE